MISAQVKFDSKATELKARSAVMVDHMMGLMASSIEIQIKTSGKTPFKKGALRSSARAMPVGPAHYEVTTNMEYAAAQEAGTTRGHVMKNYTTPGTGKGWFQDAVDTVKARTDDYARAAMSAAGLGDSL